MGGQCHSLEELAFFFPLLFFRDDATHQKQLFPKKLLRFLVYTLHCHSLCARLPRHPPPRPRCRPRYTPPRQMAILGEDVRTPLFRGGDIEGGGDGTKFTRRYSFFLSLSLSFSLVFFFLGNVILTKSCNPPDPHESIRRFRHEHDGHREVRR